MNDHITILENTAHCWEMLGYISVACVWAGVFGECFEDMFPTFAENRRIYPWKRIKKLSMALLIVGLSFEFVTQVGANNANNKVIAYLNLQANEADKHARQNSWIELTAEEIAIIQKKLEAIPFHDRERVCVICSKNSGLGCEKLSAGIIDAFREAGWEANEIENRLSASGSNIEFSGFRTNNPQIADALTLTQAGLLHSSGNIVFGCPQFPNAKILITLGTKP